MKNQFNGVKIAEHVVKLNDNGLLNYSTMSQSVRIHWSIVLNDGIPLNSKQNSVPENEKFSIKMEKKPTKNSYAQWQLTSFIQKFFDFRQKRWPIIKNIWVKGK